MFLVYDNEMRQLVKKGFFEEADLFYEELHTPSASNKRRQKDNKNQSELVEALKIRPILPPEELPQGIWSTPISDGKVLLG